MKKYIQLFPKTYTHWMRNEPFEQSAVIAYYTLFSLPSLLVIVVTIAGYFFGQAAVQNRITQEIGGFIGEGAAEAIETMISNAFIEKSSVFTVIIGVVILIFGATGVFFHLKKTMNKIWGVRVKKTNIKRIAIDRLISFGMVLVIGFMLLVSLLLSASIAFLSEYIVQYAPQITSVFLKIVNFLFSYVYVALLFTAVFKLLPDIKIRWKITFVGASITTLLFLIGEFLLGFYFSQSNPASVYGGASSVVLILLWVFYTCLILFFGAEFTVQYAKLKKEKIQPNRFSEPIEKTSVYGYEE